MSLDIVIQACRYLLNSSPLAENAMAYLDGRLNKDMQEKFAFGYFPNSQNLHLLTDLVGRDLIKESELLYHNEIEDTQGARSLDISYFEHHPLIMPYRDVYGKVVALVGRSILDEEERKFLGIEKYKNTRFIKGSHLFGLFEAKKAIIKEDFAYVVEGQFDVIKAFEKGIENIVAVGNSNLTEYQLGLLARYTNNICLFFDNDQAGKKGIERAKNKYEQFVKFSTLTLDGYKDIDEYLKTNNPSDLNSLII